MAVPGLDAVNFPEASTVPTVLLLLDQVTVAVNVFPYWSFGVAVNVKLSPTIKDLDGGETSIKFRNGGTFSTVTIAVPLTDPLVAFTMAVPGLDAVNFPEASTVPTVLLLLDQVTVAVNVFPYWSFGVAVKVWLSPTIKDLDGGETSIKFRNGGTFSTVTIAVPVTDPLVAFTMAVPGLDAVNFPEASTVPTVSLLLDHVTDTVIGLPYWSFGVAVKVC